MQNRVVVEICVESVDGALAAERGGAHRIELCSNLAVGGVTPGPELMRQVRERISLPIHVMIRPRAGSFCYSSCEFEIMQEQVAKARDLGMDGIVLGLLASDASVDVERTRKLVALAHPLPVTFHRAFDDSADLPQALEEVVRTGAKRILTSGGRRDGASKALSTLASLIERAGERIAIMPGGGVNERNVARIIQQTHAREIHASLGAPKSKNNHHGSANFEERVRKLVELSAASGNRNQEGSQ
jgi:copper homeostasis protein